MKVDIKIDANCPETAVIIVANRLTDEVAALAKSLQEQVQDESLNFIVGFADGNAAVIDINKVVRFFAAKQKVLMVTQGAAKSGAGASAGAGGAVGAGVGGSVGTGTGAQEYGVKLRLYELEERLPSKQFVRISHSEIVNLKMVKDFDLSFAGSIQVRFIDNTTTFVSRRYVANIKKVLGL